MQDPQDILQHIVIVGASSGGVEALSRLVATLPADFSVPVVIAQHLDRRRPSHLVPILQRHTSLEVQGVEDHADLHPGIVYVIPSNRMVEFAGYDIRVVEGGARRPAPSIDRLLESAADVFGERLLAVILTGAGSDGTSGARSVKENDGTVIIQDPRSAEYPEMPRSLPPTCVDFVRDLDDIGPLLAELISRPETAIADLQADDSGLGWFLTHLRTQWNIDFSQYKTPTILRRAAAPPCGDRHRYPAGVSRLSGA